MPAEAEAHASHQELLAARNRRGAAGVARRFTCSGTHVGFEGSHRTDAMEIEADPLPIFAHNRTEDVVPIVRELAPGVVLLRADAGGDAGMIPAGTADVNSAANAVQSLIAGRDRSVALFHNTPAASHRRPEAVDALTAELQPARAGARIRPLSAARQPCRTVLF